MRPTETTGRSCLRRAWNFSLAICRASFTSVPRWKPYWWQLPTVVSIERVKRFIRDSCCVRTVCKNGCCECSDGEHGQRHGNDCPAPAPSAPHAVAYVTVHEVI